MIVDDGSVDATPQILGQLDDPRVSVHTHPVNRGKGAAVRTAAQQATGDHVLICDADLEYSPEDMPGLLRPVLDGEARSSTAPAPSAATPRTRSGSCSATGASPSSRTCCSTRWISDLETCFKLMPLPLYRTLDVRSAGFGMEAEITGKLLKRGVRPYEVPISYRARSREEGKKLTWRDGVEAVWILSRIRLSR